MEKSSGSYVYEFENVGLNEASHGRGFVHGPAQIPYHWHREMELLYVLRGSVRLVLDGRNCDLGEEDLVLINPDIAHSSAPLSDDALVCGVHIDTGYFERMGLTGFASRHYQCKTFLHGPSFRQKVAPIKALIARLILSPSGRAEQAVIREMMCGVLSCYIHGRIPWAPGRASQFELRTGSRKRVLRIMDALKDPQATASLSQLAAREGLTLSHLSRLFKAHVGMGFRDYMFSARLDRAVEALRVPGNTIGHIMEETGFGNPSVFYNKFRKRFGCTPAQFRRGLQTMSMPTSLTEAERKETVARLSAPLKDIGEATALAVGLPFMSGHAVELRAPHRAG